MPAEQKGEVIGMKISLIAASVVTYTCSAAAWICYASGTVL